MKFKLSGRNTREITEEVLYPQNLETCLSSYIHFTMGYSEYISTGNQRYSVLMLYVECSIKTYVKMCISIGTIFLWLYSTCIFFKGNHRNFHFKTYTLMLFIADTLLWTLV